MKIRYTAAAVFAFATCAAFAEKQPYERYRSIVDRQMFGPLPEGFDPSKMPSEVARSSGGKQGKELTKEQEKLQSAVRFSVINITPSGETAVGFTDNSDPKTPVHYYLKVGEERGGWRVESADPRTATMTISKGDIEVTLTIGGSSGKDGGGAVAKRGSQNAAAEPRTPSTLGGRRLLRRKRDEAEMAKFREEQAAKDAEREAKAAEEKAQRDADREEQRQQLLAIQEELRKSREAAAKAKNEAMEGAENENDNVE